MWWVCLISSLALSAHGAMAQTEATGIPVERDIAVDAGERYESSVVDRDKEADIGADGTADGQQGSKYTAEEDVHTASTATPARASALPHNLSAWRMFMQADWVVKSVMIGLALASLVTWIVFIAKTQELAGLMRLQRLTLNTVIEAPTLKVASSNLFGNKGSPQLTEAAAHELKLSEGALLDGEGVKERIASRLERIEAANGRLASRGTGILASIGSTAPFIGLFGTVWGIMNSFIGISQSKTTNLAVVAPGIAEALLATAMGLVAAIPAVVIYNHFARQIAAYKALVGDTSAAVLRLVSRDLSYRSTGQ